MNNKLKTLLAHSAGILFSIAYGICAQLVARKMLDSSVVVVVSYGFVIILPICTGAITVYFGPKKLEPLLYVLYVLLAPLVVMTIQLVISMLIGWEGLICLIMGGFIFYPLAMLGGITMALILYWLRKKQRDLHPVFLSLFLFTPIVSGTIESKLPLPQEIRTVITEIDINASPQKIWQHITVIPKITEKQTGFFYKMGFPKPVEATLSFPGVGGVREAKFERGLFFLETISKWSPNDELVFDIAADPKQTPLTTLDPHVVVGGHFFDTLEGRYKIIPLGNNRSKLLLTSRYRLSTRFNIYARIWSDLLMSDIQNNILRVLKTRCEQ